MNRKLVEQKVRQVIYGGDAYDAGEVFDKYEAPVAKRMFNDYVRPDGDDLVVGRAEHAIEQIESEQYEDDGSK